MKKNNFHQDHHTHESARSDISFLDEESKTESNFYPVED